MREQGFYWVNQIGHLWEIGYWSNNDNWSLTGDKNIYNDSDFKEIDENKIVRQNWTVTGRDIANAHKGIK